MYTEMKEIPKLLIDRSKIQDALIFISEQNITTSMKVLLLIGYGRSINQTFSIEQIEFALRDHQTTDVTQE